MDYSYWARSSFSIGLDRYIAIDILQWVRPMSKIQLHRDHQPWPSTMSDALTARQLFKRALTKANDTGRLSAMEEAHGVSLLAGCGDSAVLMCF